MVLTRRSAVKALSRLLSTSAARSHGKLEGSTFYHRDLLVNRAGALHLKAKPDPDKLVFGHHYSDHMFEVWPPADDGGQCDGGASQVEWDAQHGWHRPRICPLHDLSLHPAAKVLHCAAELFEGLKAFRGVDGHIRVFRPELNMQRMTNTAARACLPTFDGEEMIKCILELVKVDQLWVPFSLSSTLYIRPTFIGTDTALDAGPPREALLYVVVGPAGSYYPGGFVPVSLYADPSRVRTSSGGVGGFKMGSNYGPTILAGHEAADMGCHQVLWLYGDDMKLTEVGSMNIFVLWINERGGGAAAAAAAATGALAEKELVTPPLTDGLVLPGVTRRSIMDLARDWVAACAPRRPSDAPLQGEFGVVEAYPTMAEVQRALSEQRLLEMFGTGTACVVCPVERILLARDGQTQQLHVPTMQQRPNLMQRLFDALTDIQFGRVLRPDWTRTVELD